MATVTGYTAEHMLEMENATVVDGNVVGNNLILITKDGTEIDAGNVRGPQGIQGLTGPLSQSEADARYLRNVGDTSSGRIIVDGVAEGLRLNHATSPYLSFFNGANRVGYIQGRNDLFIVNAEDSNPMAFFTNGVEQMRLRTGPADEILTINGNPDALIYMRASSPSGTPYCYIGKQGAYGLRATALTGVLLLQAADGDTRVQAKYTVEMTPGNTWSSSFYPDGSVGFWAKQEETEDDIPGFLWHGPWKSLRTTCNVDGRPSIYLNRQGGGAGIGESFLRFETNSALMGSITRAGAGVAYNTTSDYRAKIVKGPISGALNRLKILKPVRAIYKEDVSQSEVDTFVAHEVSPAVPEAVTGQKDAIDEITGQPILQQLDNKALIPLLVAAVQELSAKVDELQARLAPA